MLGKACQVESWWVSGLFSFKVFRAFEWARTKRRDLEIPPTRKLNEASGFGNPSYKKIERSVGIWKKSESTV